MIWIRLPHHESHLRGNFDEQGEFTGATNIVDEWLTEHGIVILKVPFKKPHPINGMNYVQWTELTMGHDYGFKYAQDAMMFKLTWT